MLMKIGQVIRQLREAARLNQADLAYPLDLEISSISRKESGKIDFTSSELEKIAEILNTTPAEMYELTKGGNIDKRRAAWNGLFFKLNKSDLDAAFRLLDKSSRNKRKNNNGE